MMTLGMVRLCWHRWTLGTSLNWRLPEALKVERKQGPGLPLGSSSRKARRAWKRPTSPILRLMKKADSCRVNTLLIAADVNVQDISRHANGAKVNNLIVGTSSSANPLFSYLTVRHMVSWSSSFMIIWSYAIIWFQSSWHTTCSPLWKLRAVKIRFVPLLRRRLAATRGHECYSWAANIQWIWVCLKIVYPYTQWFCWSLSLLNGYNWGYTPFSDIPISMNIIYHDTTIMTMTMIWKR